MQGLCCHGHIFRVLLIPILVKASITELESQNSSPKQRERLTQLVRTSTDRSIIYAPFFTFLKMSMLFSIFFAFAGIVPQNGDTRPGLVWNTRILHEYYNNQYDSSKTDAEIVKFQTWPNGIHWMQIWSVEDKICTTTLNPGKDELQQILS